nr:unnamed protein product [Callosobruchus chinensis]
MENYQKNRSTPNFTNGERNLLLKFIKSIGKSDPNQKNRWDYLAREGGSMGRNNYTIQFSHDRPSKQLRYKYEAIKKELKKRFSEHKRYVAVTGGGYYQQAPAAETEEKKTLLETISLSVQGIHNPFDSDAKDISVVCQSKDDEPRFTDCAEEIIAMAKDTKGAHSETVADDWNLPTSKLLQTPKRQGLKIR